METLNIRKKTLECAWQHLGIQSSFWIKVKVDPMVRWRGLDKINVHKIYMMYIFSTTIRHVCGLWHITKPKKNEKIIQCPPIKFLPFFKIMVFSENKSLLCIYCSRSTKQHIFWMNFQPKIKNFWMVLNLIYVYQYHSPQKKALQNSTYNLSFEVYL